MSWLDLLNWVRQNQTPAFFLGVGLLIALGMTYRLMDSAIKHVVHAIKGVPPEITVECCCSCHEEHEDEEDEEDD